MKTLADDYRLNGERIYLRPITSEDISMVLKWRNSPYVVSNFFYRKPITEEEQIQWINTKVKTGEVYQFIVCLNDDTPVGCVYLQHYNPETDTLESGVFMSGNTPEGQGIGTEAVALLNYGFAFKYLGISRTVAKVIDSNIGSLKLHEKVGFSEIGRHRCTIIPTGETVTAVEFELINAK